MDLLAQNIVALILGASLSGYARATHVVQSTFKVELRTRLGPALKVPAPLASVCQWRQAEDASGPLLYLVVECYQSARAGIGISIASTCGNADEESSLCKVRWNMLIPDTKLGRILSGLFNLNRTIHVFAKGHDVVSPSSLRYVRCRLRPSLQMTAHLKCYLLQFCYRRWTRLDILV